MSRTRYGRAREEGRGKLCVGGIRCKGAAVLNGSNGCESDERHLASEGAVSR